MFLSSLFSVLDVKPLKCYLESSSAFQLAPDSLFVAGR